MPPVRRAARALRRLTPRAAANRLVNGVETRRAAARLRSLPPTVDVVLTKACNLACAFCVDYESEGTARHVSRENFERAAAQLFPTASLLQICSGGEPWLHRGLEDMLRVARRYRLATKVLSNGMLLTEERLRPVIREGLITTHGFSVDGIAPATVERIRVNADLARILANVDLLLRIRAEEGKREPRTLIRYALMRSNVEELPAAVAYWGARGIDRIDCGYLSLANGIDRSESLFFHEELLERVLREARAAAAHFPHTELRLPPTPAEERQRPGPRPCDAPWRMVMIDADGAVLPCYRAFEALRMGNIYDGDGEAFGDVWNSADYRALRRTVNDDGGAKFYPHCARCDARLGWGELDSHRGDETWLETAALFAPDKLAVIDHRRPGSYNPHDG